jgi:hypothetical protein
VTDVCTTVDRLRYIHFRAHTSIILGTDGRIEDACFKWHRVKIIVNFHTHLTSASEVGRVVCASLPAVLELQ